jgi:hypothetical protein
VSFLGFGNLGRQLIYHWSLPTLNPDGHYSKTSWTSLPCLAGLCHAKASYGKLPSVTFREIFKPLDRPAEHQDVNVSVRVIRLEKACSSLRSYCNSSLQPLEVKKVVFLFEDSIIWTMPKPAMTPEDVEALTKALQEMHAAEVDLQKAFLEEKPWVERDKAIKKARQTRYAWTSLGAKFFTNWPV